MSSSHRSRDSRRSRRSSHDRSGRYKDDVRSHRSPSDRSRSPRKSNQKRPSDDVPLEPVVGAIYTGRVSNILAFGAVVQLEGLRKRWEGLVHVSQLRREGRVANVSDVVQRMQKVCPKVFPCLIVSRSGSVVTKMVAYSHSDFDSPTISSHHVVAILPPKCAFVFHSPNLDRSTLSHQSTINYITLHLSFSSSPFRFFVCSVVISLVSHC